MTGAETCAVVIPLFNGERWVEQALDSVFSQTLQPAEVIVVDDGSTDRSVDIVRRYPQVTLLSSGRSHLTRTRYTGISNARSSLIAFLDQDDVWCPQHLAMAHNALSENPAVNAALGRVSMFPDGGGPRFDVSSPSHDVYNPWRIFPLGNRVATPSAAVIRRDALTAPGVWKSKRHGVGDFYLWLRLAERNPLIMLEATTVGRRIHPASLYKNILRKSPLPRLESRREAAEDALRHKIPFLSDERQRLALQRRLKVAEELKTLAEAVLYNNHPQLVSVLMRLNKIIAPAERFQWENIFRQLEATITECVHPTKKSLALISMYRKIDAALARDAKLAHGVLRTRLGRFGKHPVASAQSMQ